MRRILLIVAFLCVLAFPSHAHRGSTDSLGGHYSNSYGGYHFHHGYTAHQHTNGICPYDKSGRTNWPTSKPDRQKQTLRPSSGSSYHGFSLPTAAPTTSAKPSNNSSRVDWPQVYATCFIFAFVGVICYVGHVSKH